MGRANEDAGGASDERVQSVTGVHATGEGAARNEFARRLGAGRSFQSASAGERACLFFAEGCGARKFRR